MSGHSLRIGFAAPRADERLACLSAPRMRRSNATSSQTEDVVRGAVQRAPDRGLRVGVDRAAAARSVSQIVLDLSVSAPWCTEGSVQQAGAEASRIDAIDHNCHSGRVCVERPAVLSPAEDV